MSVDAVTLPPTFPEFENHYQTVAFLDAISTRDAASAPPPFGDPVNITVDVIIAAQYCRPTKGHTSSTIQVLTHGIGFDHHYWDFGGPGSEYNYIKSATEAGYSTLSYDRIGCGKSTVLNPYTQQQVSVEVGILTTLTTLLREGGLSTFAKCHIPTPSKVAHVGHSLGSVISETLAQNAPTLSDGVVLTGFSTFATYGIEFAISSNLHIAAENDPERFGDRSNGFLTWGDELSNQYSFFYYPEFDPKVLAEAEATKFPFTVPEFLTTIAQAPAWNGPLLVRSKTPPQRCILLIGLWQMIAGDHDRIFCGGNCHGLLEKGRTYFPNAKVSLFLYKISSQRAHIHTAIQDVYSAQHWSWHESALQCYRIL